jgi:release factor family 5
MAAEPDPGTLKALVEWQPPHGVISIYIPIDHADRSEGWRVALKDGLKPLDKAKDDSHEHKLAIRATIERVLEHFPDESAPPGRCEIGFVEVAEVPGQELWAATQMATAHPAVVHRERPHLEPLVDLLDEGWPVGAIAVSSETVRLLEWRLGDAEELDRWGARINRRSWRERKAPAPRDPATGQAVSASGRDQFEQRLEANRERFLHQAGQLLDAEAGQRDWRAVLAFGDRHYVEALAADLDQARLHFAAESNIVQEELPEIAERIGEAVVDLNRRRELELVERAEEAALAGKPRGSLGLKPTVEALEIGRVETLIFQGDSRDPEERTELVSRHADELIEDAVLTSADITPVEGEAARALTPHEGVAAIWRY